MRSARFRFRSLLALMAVLTSAACGQKAGVGGPDRTAAPVVASSSSSSSTVTTAAPASSARGVAGTATGSAPVARSGPAPTAGSRAASAAGLPSPPTAPSLLSGPNQTAANGAIPSRPARPDDTGPASSPSPDPHDRDGVSDKEIVIGVHAPLTGAAPVPEDSVDKAKDLYWKFIGERGGIFGRNVRVVFRDDQFNPSRAVTVCREMVEQEHAFVLFGIGTDQVVSCARYASQAGVPYFSMGGGEAALAQVRNYFAISMSFPQQAPMVAQVVKRAGKTKVAVVVINTPNYDDTFAAMVQSAKSAGLSVVRADRIGKQASESEVLAETNNLRTSGAEAVIVAVAPVTFLNLAHAAQGQAYSPLWTGPGLANGLNLVAEFGCPSIAGARFLSPMPELDVIDRLDPDYKPAYRKYNNGAEPDDLGLAVWGMEKTLHQFLKAAGPDLGRTRLIATIQSGQEFASGVFPPVRFGPNQRFGAGQAHLLEADCANRRYRTLATFASSF
ncbi:MAG: branched-chain amino acid transport system substrate-binding protein [Actinomycetota bacterium]|nr:branched-chain amino acid transport system substrate-binding protein [Actinomycetota bacterium]